MTTVTSVTKTVTAVTRNERNEKLLERLLKFSEKIILLCKKLPNDSVNQRLIPQIIGSSSSMCANYSEACEAESRADFLHKIRIVQKEARESRSHLRLLYVANPSFISEIVMLGKESVEYIKIFSKINSGFKLRN